MIKRILLIIITSIVISGCSSQKFSDATYKETITVEGTIFDGDPNVNELEISFNPNWISKDRNIYFNPELGKTAALLCTDSYFRQKDLDKGIANRVMFSGLDYDISNIFTKLGFTDFKHIESFKEKEYKEDANDSVTMSLAYMPLDKYDTFVVVIRGSYSAGEWMTIFDVGAGDEYRKLTGDHEYFTDEDLHKGIDVAKNRAKEFIEDYVNEHDRPDKENTMLLTGHSRGAAIANAIGKDYEDSNFAKMYTYVFNTISYVINQEDKKYNTIFNIFDDNDLYKNIMPFKNGSASYYGSAISDDTEKILSTSVKPYTLNLKNQYEYDFNENCINDYESLFSRLFADREDLYHMEKIGWFGSSDKEYIDTLEADLNNAKQYLAIDDKYLNIKRTNDTELSTIYCKAAILQGCARIMAYGQPAYEQMQLLFTGQTWDLELAKYFSDNLSELNKAHYLINSLIILDNIISK